MKLRFRIAACSTCFLYNNSTNRVAQGAKTGAHLDEGGAAGAGLALVAGLEGRQRLLHRCHRLLVAVLPLAAQALTTSP